MRRFVSSVHLPPEHAPTLACLMTTLGPSLRNLWDLLPDGTFLNHGSFGACPKVVLAAQAAAQARMESQPDQFFRHGAMPDAGETPLRAAAAALARFVNAGDDEVAFVENA